MSVLIGGSRVVALHRACLGLRLRKVHAGKAELADVLPTAADVEEASIRLRARIKPSPVSWIGELNRRAAGARADQAESSSTGGSFKSRGASTGLLGSRRTGTARRRGHFSSEHAQGVCTGRGAGGQATNRHAPGSPRIKRLGTEQSGARVVCTTAHGGQERIGEDLRPQRAVLLPPSTTRTSCRTRHGGD